MIPASGNNCNHYKFSPSSVSVHGVKLKKIVGGVQNPKLPAKRLRSSPRCRQIGLF